MEAIYALIALGEEPDTLGTFLDTSITTPSSSSSAPPPEKSHSRTWLGLTAIAYLYLQSCEDEVEWREGE
jgi:hypothetical protein